MEQEFKNNQGPAGPWMYHSELVAYILKPAFFDGGNP